MSIVTFPCLEEKSSYALDCHGLWSSQSHLSAGYNRVTSPSNTNIPTTNRSQQKRNGEHTNAAPVLVFHFILFVKTNKR